MVELNIGAVRVGDALAFQYRVKNDSGRAIFVQHRAHLGAARAQPFVHLSAPGTAVLFVGTAKPPVGVSLAGPGTPPADLVEPGDSVEGAVEIPIPLVEGTIGLPPDGPLGGLYDVTRDPDTVTALCMIVDYHVDRPGLHRKQYFDGSWAVSGATPERMEGWVHRLPVPVPVLRSRVPFDRVAPAVMLSSAERRPS